jgi:hypothetical protein
MVCDAMTRERDTLRARGDDDAASNGGVAVRARIAIVAVIRVDVKLRLE